MKPNRLLAEVERLKAEGHKVLATRRTSPPPLTGDYVDSDSFTTWLMGCRGFLRLLGEEIAAPWGEPFLSSAAATQFSRARMMSATLQAIGEAIEHGLLVRLEDIVTAEVFDSLLEQAEYLLKENWFLAAGVLGRAVLEEHLRTWCKTAKCFPAAARPMLNDYNMELYKAKQYDKAVMKHLDAMIAVGNNAAHNKTEFDPTSVEPLLRDLREFLGKHPIE